MTERELVERLHALLAGDGAPAPDEEELRDLVEIASILRDLPDDAFRTELRRDLERTALMTRTDDNVIMRHGKLSYVHIPAPDPARSAAFYAEVFGWELRGDPAHPSFTDPTGHFIGAWVTDRPVVRDPGVLPYIYVDRVDDALSEIVARGGEVVTPPYPEGALWVATFRDPAGNVLGVWQSGPR